MRRFLLLSSLVFVILIAVGGGIALGAHLAEATHGATITIDGQTVDGSAMAAGIGALGGLVAAVVCVLVVVALASIAVIVPVAIALALFAALIAVVVAIVVGLSPIVVPVLLVVGVCALLSRRSKQSAPANAAAMPMPLHTPNSPPIS